MNNLEIKDGISFIKDHRLKSPDQPCYLVQLDNWYDVQERQEELKILQGSPSLFPCITAQNYVGMLRKFCHRRKLRLPKEIDSMFVDWLDVKTKVDQFHGAKMVSSKRQWYFVSQSCNITNQDKLKQYYFQYVRKFEEYTESIGLDPLEYENGGFLTKKDTLVDYLSMEEFDSIRIENDASCMLLYQSFTVKNPNLQDSTATMLEFFWNEISGGRSELYFDCPRLELNGSSLFPSIDKDIYGSHHALNFKALLNSHDNLLRFDNYRHAGFKETTLTYNSLFSYSVWKTHPQFMYSLYTLHDGAQRTWYAISSKHISKLYNLINSKYPEVLVNDGIPLNINVPIEPKELKDAGIPFSVYTQSKSQIMIVFPGTYYFYVDLGSNCVEQVTICIPDWLQFGLKYKKFCDAMTIVPKVCIEEIIYKQIKYRCSNKSLSKYMRPYWTVIAEQELNLRMQILYFIKDIEFIPLTIDDLQVRLCALTHLPCFFTFLQNPDGLIYHPKALCQLQSKISLNQLKCYYIFSENDFRSVDEQLRIISLGDRHLWNANVKQKLFKKMSLTEIDAFIKLGLELDENLEEVSFLNNYSLYVKKICNQLPKLPIYDGQFRGRKDHKSRYTFEQIRTLNEALELLEVDSEELTTFHTKFYFLNDLHLVLQEAIRTNSGNKREIKRNCERSGVIMNHQLLLLEDFDKIEKQTVYGFSFYPASAAKSDLDPLYMQISANTSMVHKVIDKIKSRYLFEDELQVALHCLSECSLQDSKAKYLLDNSKEYYTIKQHVLSLLQQDVKMETTCITSILELFNQFIVPSHHTLLKINKFFKALATIYSYYCTNLFIKIDVHPINLLLCKAGEHVEQICQLVKSIQCVKDQLLYHINRGNRLVSQLNTVGPYCICGVKENRDLECTNGCGLKFHTQCVLQSSANFICCYCLDYKMHMPLLFIDNELIDVAEHRQEILDPIMKDLYHYAVKLKSFKPTQQSKDYIFILPWIAASKVKNKKGIDVPCCCHKPTIFNDDFIWCFTCGLPRHLKCGKNEGYATDDNGYWYCKQHFPNK